MRTWHYWTENKLAILADYIDGLTRASKTAGATVFIDLMAGEPENISERSGQPIDGSPRIAMRAQPAFTKLAFGELDAHKVAAIEADLHVQFPGQEERYKVFPGDCNETIDDILQWLFPYRHGSAFAFVDQQSAEVRWETIRKLAHFRKGKYKAELWVLFSPAMFVRNINSAYGPINNAKVSAMYGNDIWRVISDAKAGGRLSAAELRDELVNLFRWQLQDDLGYNYTARIPMLMRPNLPIYEMVFATDHPVGLKIMSHLYKKAAEREEGMMREAIAQRYNETKLGKSETLAMFDVPTEAIAPLALPNWQPDAVFDPRSRSWWPS